MALERTHTNISGERKRKDGWVMEKAREKKLYETITIKIQKRKEQKNITSWEAKVRQEG